MKSKKELHEYWKKPPAENKPANYINKTASPFLVDVFKEWIKPKDYRILEVGCNVGRNLNALYLAGYSDLHGVDINPEAVKLMRETYPAMSEAATVTVSPIEDFDFFFYNVIFSVAVMCHIHPDSNFVFERIAESTNVIITLEDETTNRDRHYARDYEKVFSDFSFRQFAYYPEVAGMNASYRGRVLFKTDGLGLVK